MISLDQVRLLEKKVEIAVNKIVQLQKENAELCEKCKSFESRTDSLSQKVSLFEADQNKIEEGILHVLERLNIVEDSVREVAKPESTIVQDSVPQTAEKIVEEPTNQLANNQEPFVEQENQIPVQQNLEEQTQLEMFSTEPIHNQDVSIEQQQLAETISNQQEQSQSSQGQFDIF